MNKRITPTTTSNDVVYFVTVDSRGEHHHASDLECYKEGSVSSSYFQRHIINNNNYINVKSQVARLCGLDLELYFVDQPSDEFKDHSGLFQKKKTADENIEDDEDDDRKTKYNKINSIATLLCFNPDTGYYNYIVKDQAYVILNGGTTELSKRQVWGIQEFIRETKDYYHKDGHHYSHEAKMKLLGWAHDYIQGTWAPHSIYETRHTYNHHLHPQHHHHKHHHHHRNSDHIKHDEHTSYWKKLTKLESGVTDAATYHHGSTKHNEKGISEQHHTKNRSNPFRGFISACTSA